MIYPEPLHELARIQYHQDIIVQIMAIIKCPFQKEKQTATICKMSTESVIIV